MAHVCKLEKCFSSLADIIQSEKPLAPLYTAALYLLYYKPLLHTQRKKQVCAIRRKKTVWCNFLISSSTIECHLSNQVEIKRCPDKWYDETSGYHYMCSTYISTIITTEKLPPLSALSIWSHWFSFVQCTMVWFVILIRHHRLCDYKATMSCWNNRCVSDVALYCCTLTNLYFHQ